MHLPLNQRGISQILLPLFLLAAIGLTVYLAQQQTDITPSAAEVPTTAPTGCKKVTPGNRSVRYKNCQSASESCNDQTNLVVSQNGEQDYDPFFKFDGKVVATYPLKETVWDFGGWKLHEMKGPRNNADGDRTTISEGRFDGPSGTGFKKTDDDVISSNGTTRDGNKIEYGSGVIVEYAFQQTGSGLKNYQGISTTTKFDPSRSFAFVPENENSGVKCNGATSTGAKANDAACTPNKGAECKSGVCTNSKCAQGTKKGNEACTNKEECQSNTCSNGKCAGGAAAVGRACDDNADCASNKCGADKKCASATTSNTTSNTTNNTTTNRTNTTNNTTGGGGGSTASTAPGASSSPASSSSPSASAVPTSLTKAEITGFSNSYKALAGRLGTASNSGNLKVASTIAGTELDSIVSQLPTCPDDSGVGKCLDDKFRTRFDFAKTAARLTAFYAIFNNVSGLCVKSDFGLNPLITTVSTTNTTGRVNLCTEPTAASKIWRIFAAGKFEPVLASDTRWPANPTCASLPQDVATHYRNAERLFNTQSGFTENTLCDGKTSVAPEGTSSPAP